MKIEILFAVDQEDNTKINLLAIPYGGDAGHDFIKDALFDNLGIDDEDDKLADILSTGEETSHYGYDFGWETIELITDKIIIRPL